MKLAFRDEDDRGVFHVLSGATLEEAVESVCEDDRELVDCLGDDEGPRDTYAPGA